MRGTVFALWPLFAAFVLMGVFLGAAASGAGRVAMVASLALFAGGAVAAVCLWPRMTRRVGNYFTGARGEERVAAGLAALGGEWHVFNDFAFGAFRVDHVVVGPGGVFAVETKNWNGQVTLEDGKIFVDGEEPTRDPVAQTARECDAVGAAVARAAWKGGVHGVLCFASGTFKGGACAAGGITVLNACELAGFIEGKGKAAGEGETERLAEVLAAMAE